MSKAEVASEDVMKDQSVQREPQLRRYLTPAEAADVLKISERAVIRAAKKGHLKAVYVGRKVRLDPRPIVLSDPDERAKQ